MARRLLILLLLAACFCMRPVAVFTQQTPQIDTALVAQFVAADAAAREVLIRSRPEILDASFAAALNNEGQRLRNAADFDGSLQHHRAALYIGEQYDRPATVVSSKNALSLLASAQSNAALAMQLSREALALAERTNDLAGQQQSWGNIGALHRRSAELEDAAAAMERAIDLAKRLNDPLLVGRAMHTAGVVQSELGNTARALDIMLQAVANKIAGKAPPGDFLTSFSVIGSIYSNQGELDVAMDYYKRAIDVMNGEVNATVAGVYSNIGLIQRARRQYDDARKTYAMALPIARRFRSEGIEATIIFNLAQIAWHEEELDKAEDLFRQSLTIRERVGPQGYLMESLDSLSGLLAERGRYDEALPLAERAVYLSSQSRMLDELWRARVSAGTAYMGLQRYDEARASFEHGIETIETLRTLAPIGNGEPHAIFEKLTPYYELAELDIKVGRTFDGLAAVDRARARTLVEILSTREAPSRNLTEAEREHEQEMTNAILDASDLVDAERANAAPDRARLTTFEAQLASARAARDAYITNLFAQRPDLRLSSGRTSPVTPAQLAGVLTPGTAVISFVLEDHTSWVYVATAGPGGPVVTAHALLKGNDELLSTTAKFVEQVSSRDLAFSPTARASYDLLFGPAEARLRGITHLIIIPDGPLWRLPFQALMTPRGTFMIEERAVSYAPSIAALVALEARRRSRPAATPFLLALGDPLLSTSAATSPGNSAAQRGESFARLPEAGREVLALRSLYGAARSDILTSAAASEGALRARATRATVLHLATHGVLDDKSPMYSRLLLAPGPGTSADDDGRLEAWEVMEMGVTADIAVLSACQTAGAGPGFGEGLMGLSWSLFASGASTAVVSQWAVDSASTTELMLAFHRRLLAERQRDGAPARALRQASLSLLKKAAYRHPFYWAGFMSIGAK